MARTRSMKKTKMEMHEEEEEEEVARTRSTKKTKMEMHKEEEEMARTRGTKKTKMEMHKEEEEMARTRGTKKTKMEVHEEEEEEEIKDEDRLSDLPDSIILHILSFLETKFSVRTCLLSRRWKCLWASVPDLNFSVSRSNKNWFKKFVRQVLVRRNDIPITNCSFQYSGIDKPFTYRVITYALSQRVKHFCISLGFAPLSFLSPVLSCRSISPLTLTTLILSDCSFYACQCSFDPFASLINLKNLELNHCRFRGFLKISGPQLHSLTLKALFRHEDCKVEIFAPKLSSFSFQDTYNEAIEFSFLGLPVLDCPRKEESDKANLELISNFIGLCHVQSLKLSSRTIEVLLEVPGRLENQPSPFCRQQTLKLQCKEISLNIPQSLLKYCQSGSTDGENVENELWKSQRHEP